MKLEEFFAELNDIMQRDEALSLDDSLADIEEFDSLARLGFMTFIEEAFGVDADPEAVAICETVADLLQFTAGSVEK